MAKKNFKSAATASMQVPNIGQIKPSEEVKEKRKVTTFLLKPSIQKRFKIVCVEKELKIGDELEGMFVKWLEEQEN